MTFWKHNSRKKTIANCTKTLFSCETTFASSSYLDFAQDPEKLKFHKNSFFLWSWTKASSYSESEKGFYIYAFFTKKKNTKNAKVSARKSVYLKVISSSPSTFVHTSFVFFSFSQTSLSPLNFRDHRTHIQLIYFSWSRTLTFQPFPLHENSNNQKSEMRLCEIVFLGLFRLFRVRNNPETKQIMWHSPNLIICIIPSCRLSYLLVQIISNKSRIDFLDYFSFCFIQFCYSIMTIGFLGFLIVWKS